MAKRKKNYLEIAFKRDAITFTSHDLGTYMQTTAEQIKNIKTSLGDSVCIVGHHYQAQNIVDHCDITGDSLELARKVAPITAPHIVFCGVYFMAESAALLAREGQSVHIPDAKANCVMSQMTPAPLLERILENLHTEAQRRQRTLIPLAYVNTSLAVKALVGKYGGAVCTSANASTMLQWALDKGDHVLFLPDKNLAQNTGSRLGLCAQDYHLLDIRGQGSRVQMNDVFASRMLLWPGCCAIHAKFAQKHMDKMRASHPGCHIVVHPESHPHVVDAADGAGSTSFLIDYVKKAPAQSTIIIGTETNLVERLRRDYAQTHNVLPLREAYCSHMAKISETALLQQLQDIQSGCAPVVRIVPKQAAHARTSLERMLQVCERAGI